MIELEQITVCQYLELEDKSEYHFAMKFAIQFTEPIDEFKIGDCMELPFGIVKDFQFDLEQGITFDKGLDYLSKITKRTIKQLTSEPVDKFFRGFNYLKKSIQDIIDVEAESLAHEPTEEEIEAGMDKFEGLGVYMQIRSLCNGDITKYVQIRALPYSLCFTEMYTAKQTAEYQKALSKIYQRRPPH